MRNGQFGDTFGGLSALFTALGILGLVWTVVKQIEAERARDADLKSLQNQRSEDLTKQLLFRFLDNIQSHIAQMDRADVHNHVHKGKDALSLYFRFINLNRKIHHESTVEEYVERFREIYGQNHTDLAPYYDSIWSYLECLSESKFDGRDAFVMLLASQFTPNERFMLQLMCLSNLVPGMKGLVENLGVLRDVRNPPIDPEGILRRRFAESAFRGPSVSSSNQIDG